MKLEIDTSMANNLSVFTGEVKREPTLTQAMIDGQLTNVMNFDLVLKYQVRVTEGQEMTNYVKCSAWGDDNIASAGTAVGRAFQHNTKIVVIGAVVPSLFTFKVGAGRTIGIFKVSTLSVVEVPSGGKASVKPSAGHKAKVAASNTAAPVKGKAVTKTKTKTKKPSNHK
jgi:hypothetical protein